MVLCTRYDTDCLIQWTTVRGMMYYRKALELQSFLDMAKDEGNHIRQFFIWWERCYYDLSANFMLILCLWYFSMILHSDLMEGYKAMELTSEDSSGRSLWTQCQAVADMKFTYVVSCQQYGIQKRSGDTHAQDILKLMAAYVLKTSYATFIYIWCPLLKAM